MGPFLYATNSSLLSNFISRELSNNGLVTDSTIKQNHPHLLEKLPKGQWDSTRKIERNYATAKHSTVLPGLLSLVSAWFLSFPLSNSAATLCTSAKMCSAHTAAPSHGRETNSFIKRRRAGEGVESFGQSTT